MVEVTQREKTKTFPVITLLTVSHPQPLKPKLKFQNSRFQSNCGEYKTVRAEDRPMMEKQSMSLKSKKPSVRLRKRKRSSTRGIWSDHRQEGTEQGKSPWRTWSTFKRLGLQLVFGFHVASEDLCVLYGFLLIKLSQALCFPDRSCEREYRKDSTEGWGRDS